MTNYVVFDLETVPDLDIARRLLNLGAEMPNEEVRVTIGQKYARPDQDPREIFLKPLFHRIVCIGAVFAERDHDGPFSVRSIGARHIGEKDEPKLIGDFLADNHFFGTIAAGRRGVMLLSSASSKTAYATAAQLARRPEVEVVGLTSPGQVAFCESLGCYDRVLTYDQLDTLAADTPCVYVDFAGNGALRQQLYGAAEGMHATPSEVAIAQAAVPATLRRIAMTTAERIEPGNEGHGGDAQEHGASHQHAGGHHRRASESPLARGQQRQGQDLDAQCAGQEAVHLFTPGLVGLQRADLRRRVADGLFHVLRPGGLAIAGRPVRAAQAGIGQAHEGTEHDRARGHDHGEPRQAVEIAVQRRTRGKAHQTGLTSVSATWPCPCAGLRDRSRGHDA